MRPPAGTAAELVGLTALTRDLTSNHRDIRFTSIGHRGLSASIHTLSLTPRMSYARMIGRAILRMVRNTQVLRVDLMPDHDDVLGFSNHWYPQALETAQPVSLGGGLSIRVVAPPLFVATKLEAYKGRGEGDPLSSHDIEDIFNLVDGRPELLDEVRAAGSDLRACIADELSKLLANALFGYAVQSAAGDPNRNEAYFIAMIYLIGSLCGACWIRSNPHEVTKNTFLSQ